MRRSAARHCARWAAGTANTGQTPEEIPLIIDVATDRTADFCSSRPSALQPRNSARVKPQGRVGCES